MTRTDRDGVIVVDHPLVQHKLTLMRDARTPTAQFRELVGELGALLTYEATRDLPTVMVDVETPLEETEAPVLAGRKPALVSILRAGNGLLDGALKVLPMARVGFVGLFRDEETLEPHRYYFKMPEGLEHRRVIVVDPMLATGNSAAAALSMIREAGARELRFVCVVAAPEGVQRLRAAHPDVPIFTAAIDRQLNAHGYILPGLGDAGDRLYGTR